MKKESVLTYYMTMKGTDNMSEWTAEGYYIMTASGAQLWMLKDYKDK
jgi:hypothetical protein